MNTTQTTTLIIGTLSQYGYAVLAIITATLAIGLAYLIFKFGIKRLLFDKSLTIGGYYLRNTPYKGYNRFRSKAWNMKNTM